MKQKEVAFAYNMSKEKDNTSEFVELSRRTLSRIFAVELLYSLDFNLANLKVVIRDFLSRKRWELDEAEASLEDDPFDNIRVDEINIGFFKKLVKGVVEHKARIVELIINSLSDNIEIKDIDRVTLSILYVGVYELLYELDIPNNVTINETLNVSHAFLPCHRATIINGVLDKISKNL